MPAPFHLAIPVHDLGAARAFYGRQFGCPEGRSSAEWVDFDFFGHQIVAHLTPNMDEHKAQNVVDGAAVPVRHFGVILTMDAWQELAERLSKANVQFLIAPQLRFQGQPGEQATLFITDPSGNALEFKAFANDARIFAR